MILKKLPSRELFSSGSGGAYRPQAVENRVRHRIFRKQPNRAIETFARERMDKYADVV